MPPTGTMNIDPPPEWAELPGTFTIGVGESHSDYFTRNMVVIRAEHRIAPGYKVGAIIPVSQEILDDCVGVNLFIQRAMDRHIRPWAYPDRPVVISFTPFPRWDRFARWVRYGLVRR